MAFLALGLVAALPAASSSAAGLDLRLGGFFPRADSNLFHDDSQLYHVSKDDWEGFTGGVEGTFIVARNVELGVHMDGYGKTIDTSYRDFVDSNGGQIQQSLELDELPVGFSIRFVSTNRRTRLAPYLAVGGDLVFWQYEEHGDFVDFLDPQKAIIHDHFRSTGVAPGFHAAAGLRVALNEDFSLVGEGRYLYAKEHDMGEDFRGNELDLSGWSATLGLHIRF
jgi:hypothetical protein